MILPTRRAPLLGRDGRTGPSELGLYVPPEEVFPGVTASESALIDLLATLSRDDTLFQCARLNTIISGPGDSDIKPRQEQALSQICSQEHIDRINDFAWRHKMSGPPVVFFRGQLLELMRWAARHCRNLPNDGTTYEDAAFRERFLKAALIGSTLWSNRTYGEKLSVGDDIAELRLRALGALRKGVEEGNFAPHIGVAIGRGLKLFTEYLPKHYPRFAEEFEHTTDLTPRQYLACATTLCLYTLQHRKEGPLFLSQAVAAETTYRDIFPKFFIQEAQTPEELAISFWENFGRSGYRALRERPIMITADGRGMILDPTFFIERISIGALFHVAKGKKRSESLEIFTAFGNAFEEYVADILKRMYPSRPGLVDRVACGIEGQDARGRSFQIDAALADMPQAVVIETKATFLREEAIIDKNSQALVEEIRSKYGAASKKGERDKGVAQLARSIGAIVRGEWEAPHREFEGITAIHPVLVVHDTRLDAPALGHFLANEFTSLLGAVPAGKHVFPLTVMTIQDLENLEKSVSTFSFVNLLKDYSCDCPDRMRSLHNYIVFSGYVGKIVPSDFLIEASAGILQVLIDELFPKPATEHPNSKGD